MFKRTKGIKVSELIEKLKSLPQDAEVWHVCDGVARTKIAHVWLSKGGDVITADEGEAVYSNDSRPIDAPNWEEAPYWETPSHECVYADGVCVLCGDTK